MKAFNEVFNTKPMKKNFDLGTPVGGSVASRECYVPLNLFYVVSHLHLRALCLINKG